MTATARRSAEHQRAVLERRRSGATRPVPARKVRRKNTRRDAKRVAVERSQS